MDSTSVESQTFYYVVLDTNIDVIDKLGTKDNIFEFLRGSFFGRIRLANNLNSLPVLFDLDEAKSVADKLVKTIVSRGSMKCGTSNDPCYPVFGAVILGYKLNSNLIRNAEKGEIFNEGGARNYEGVINGGGHEMTTYDVNGKKRGVVHQHGFRHLKLCCALYHINNTDIGNLGFSILNTRKNLTVDNILILKMLYDKKDMVMDPLEQLKQLKLSENTKKSTNMSSLGAQNGGNNDEKYKTLYIQEKQKYLQMKKSLEQTGGNNDEEHYKNLYMQEKQKYLQMKKNLNQTGGDNENSSMNYKNMLEQEKEKYMQTKTKSANDYEALYRQEKEKYLFLKKNLDNYNKN